ncbi:MAG: hypothetical protein J5725_06240 [Bacteroidales bacterium]|nr:hypothetical protein [Bacteroidales bacterium]
MSKRKFRVDASKKINATSYAFAISGEDMISTLDSLEVGTPVLVDAGTGNYTQAIYQGIGDIQYRTAYMFYDGSGISGTFGLSRKFILENPGTVSMVLDDNDPTKVADLLNTIQGGTDMKRKFRVDASKKVEAKKYSPALHSTFDGLDDRFSFDLDEEFEIYLDTLAKPIKCYVFETGVFGGGAGMTYTVAVAVPREDVHWQIKEDIERNLDRHIKEQVDGSDYTGWVEDNEFNGTVYDIADEVFDNCEIYVYDICVVPYQNISPWGEYGIDFGTEEYLDSVNNGTPFPPEI